MKTLVTAIQKGGVGKTSTVVHLAFYFEELGLRVAVIDTDVQGNASYTLNQFKSGFSTSQIFNGDMTGLKNALDAFGSEPGVFLVEADAGLADMEKRSLSDAAKKFNESIKIISSYNFDICIVDTPPSLGVSMASSLYSADYVLSPVELETYSMQGIKKMVATIASVRQTNKKLKFLGMLPSKVDGRNPRHVKHKKELDSSYPQLLLPTSIGLRGSIAEALSKGIPVWRIKKSAARVASKEIKGLAEHIRKAMEIA